MERGRPPGDLEWSAEAATAWDDIEQAATHTFAPSEAVVWPRLRMSPVPTWRVGVSAFLANNPGLCDPSWGAATDAEPEADADYRPDAGYGGVPGRPVPRRRPADEDGCTFSGHRAALYVRTAARTGWPACSSGARQRVPEADSAVSSGRRYPTGCLRVRRGVASGR